MNSTISSYNLVSARLDTWTRAASASPIVARDTKYYLERIPDIKTIDEFLRDDRVFSFAMKAYGLADMTYAKAFMRKVLTDGVDSPEAFANQLADRRYAEFAATFNFKRYGETTTIFDKTRQPVVDRHVRQTLEEAAGATNENVRLALYFQRTAGAITTPYSILADRALTKVVYTALGLPASTSAVDIDAQARLISDRIDLADFKSPAKVQKFIARFAAQADSADGRLSATPALSLISTGAVSARLTTDTLLAVQSLRLGGRPL